MGIFIMKEIKLTQGMVALVDDEDFERVNQHKWYACKGRYTYYAARNIQLPNKRTVQRLHKEIMNGKLIDHEDHNGLNCQKYNMRSCTTSQNMMNKIARKNSTSIYKGVGWNIHAGKWMSRLLFKGKTYYLGLFINEIDAAKIYDTKAKEIFKEFAYLNFPEIECKRTKFINN